METASHAPAVQAVPYKSADECRTEGKALARADARSADAALIAGYMGSSHGFDDALCEFAVEYPFVEALRQGRLTAIIETA